MIEVEEMHVTQIQNLIHKATYAHLGVAREGRPYVVPMNYAYRDPHIYIFTTEGQKTVCLADNPEVCLQIEEVTDPTDWQSVVIQGRAERLTNAEEIEHAMQAITERNPSLTPALNKMWIDPWGRANVVALYRITPDLMSGRKTVPAGETRGPGALSHKAGASEPT